MLFFVHCRIKPGGALNVLESLIQKEFIHGQSVDAIFTIYSDRDYLLIPSSPGGIEGRCEASIPGVPSKKQNSGNFDGLDSSLRSEGQKIPIITALPNWLNRLFRRSDETKPLFISSIIDYRNLMPIFPELMEILSWKLKNREKPHPNLSPYQEEGLSSIEQSRDSDGHPSVRRTLPGGTSGEGTRVRSSWGEVYISSYAVAKNIHIPDGYQSTIYFHQPMHYIWTLYDAYVGSMQGRKKKLYELITPRLRRRDARPRIYDTIYANSESTKKQIKDIYFPLLSPKIEVIHPPIAEEFFHEQVVTKPDNYFFYINRLTKLFKHLDRIILLCNKYKVPLIIAGDGPDKAYLQSIAGPTITFVGWVSNIHDKIALIKRSRGILNIAHESFGIVTAEALLLGVPIFGYDGGATSELVDKKSGILTPSVEIDTMSSYFEKFLMTEFDRQEIQDQAKKLLIKKQEFWKE